MSAPRGHAVAASSARYLTALAELPRSARRAAGSRDAIVVIERPDWVEGSLAALGDGALALVVPHPRCVGADDVRRIADAAAGRPVIVERPLVPDSLAARAAPEVGEPAVSAVVAECVAPAGEEQRVLRDAVRWLALLGGAAGDAPTITLRHAAARVHGALAAVDVPTAAGVVPGSVLLTVRGGGAGMIRALALGARRTEVLARAGRASLTRSDHDGHLECAARPESSARSAIRRAIAAIEAGAPGELGHLAADASVARGVHETR